MKSGNSVPDPDSTTGHRSLSLEDVQAIAKRASMAKQQEDLRGLPPVTETPPMPLVEATSAKEADKPASGRTDIWGDIEKLDARVKATDKELLNQMGKRRKLEERLEALEAESTRMKTRYSGIDGQLEKLLLRMTSLEQSSAAERSVLDIHEELGGIQRRLDALQAEAEHMKDFDCEQHERLIMQIAKLQNQVGPYEGFGIGVHLQALQERLERLERRMENLDDLHENLDKHDRGECPLCGKQVESITRCVMTHVRAGEAVRRHLSPSEPIPSETYQSDSTQNRYEEEPKP